jgi:hypothetical protein
MLLVMEEIIDENVEGLPHIVPAPPIVLHRRPPIVIHPTAGGRGGRGREPAAGGGGKKVDHQQAFLRELVVQLKRVVESIDDTS